MDIKILKNFVEIVDSGSLTAASKKLFIAQPALSNQLKALETEMNTVLIERNSRHQKLTDAGKLFYDRAKAILLMENALIKEIGDVRDGDVGSLKMATIISGEMILLQDILPRFVKRYPKVSYQIYEKESNAILDLLKDGEVDVAIVRTPCNLDSEMDVFFISDERLVCVYDPEIFSLDTDSDQIRVSQLGDLPLIIIRRYEEIFRDLCEEEAFHPNIRCINQQLTVTLKWAEAGLGIAILPEDMLSQCTKPLAVRSFAAGQMATKRAIVTMKNAFHSKAVKNFLAFCHENF